MRALVAGGLLLVLAAAAHAQAVETPVPFDSARRVLVVTPALADRLHLDAPAWPVNGEYRDARLYAASTGGFVLVAQLASGALQRYMLTDAQRSALGAAIDAAVATSGRPVTEASVDAPSEPAGNGFARHVTVLSALVYAPLAASLFDDGQAAGAAYFIVAGGAFFASYGAAQSGHITRAQSDLAANLGLAGGAGGLAVAYAATGNADKGPRAAALGAAVVGMIAGANLGRHLTDAEAHSATLGIETAAAATWSIGAAAGLENRGMAAAVAASEPLGYVLGVRYPRVASYAVTAGDANAVQTAGLVGAAFGGALLGSGSATSRRTGIAVGASYVGGVIVGDLALARPFDFTTSEANLVTVGAIAGGLMGLALPLISDSDNRSLILGSVGGGATIGMSLVVGLTNPRHAGESRLQPTTPSRLSLLPGGLLGVATRAPGPHPLVQLRF